MNFERKELINGRTVITTSYKPFFRKKFKQFEAQREHPKGYWVWLELPEYKLVVDHLSFQLDEWNRVMEFNKE